MAILGVFLVLGSAAFACTTYQGKMTVKGNTGGATGTSVADGDNDCPAVGTCFPGGERMTYCGSVTFNATAAAIGGKVTVQLGSTTLCPVTSNALAGNSTFDVNYRYGRTMTTSDTQILDADDCMSWTIGSVTVNLGTIMTDGSGAAGPTSYDLTSPTTANNTGEYAGICVSDAGSHHGNQVPVKVV